jgi:hypothetical protein
VKSEHWDEALLADHRSSITKSSAAKAFDALIAAAVSLRGYETEPAWQGEVRIFKYVDPVSGERPFAFIVNRGDILFYIRDKGLARVPGGFSALRRRLETAVENKRGEWTVRIASTADASQLNDLLFSGSPAPARPFSAKSYTYYWRNSEAHWHDDDYQTLEHAVSNLFRVRGVRVGATVYVVTIVDGNVHLGGALRVDKILTLRAARKRFRNDFVEGKDHIVMENLGPFYKELVIPTSALRALRFDGDKALVFKSAGTLDTQTLRGIRELTPASATLLANLLESARQQERQTAAMFPNKIESAREYIEGACKQVTVNAYERDPKARKACLGHHGFDCGVCSFNFEAKYGERGREFIHVHHLNPMALTDGEYVLNPITDLRPVCPNCHAMLHRGDDLPLSIEELKRMLKVRS